MALSNPTLLNATTNTTSATSEITTDAAISPTAGGFLVLVAVQRRSVVDTSLPVVLTNGGTLNVTWTERQADFGLRDAGGQSLTLSVWTGVPAGTPGSGTVHVDFDGNGFLRGVLIYEVTGQHATPYVRSALNDGNDLSALTVTLGASPAADSLIFAAVFCTLSAGITPDTGYTELDEIAIDVNNQVQTMYRNGGADTTVEWTTLGGDYAIGVAIEIAAEEVVAEPNVVGQMVVGETAVDMHGWIVINEELIPL